ncbi:MAG TPA: LysR family transcriptional regulator [Dongiaceae bacterium]|jgi:DNA-binding transcriptional LysR family regulator|nr:LysR family transcriptional regulator [Dongiaceae bacterium]
MDTDTLGIFIDVMRWGSFAAVARRRNIDPSYVSRAIAGLETELGTRLFQRSTRRNQPTEAGALYYEKIEPILEELVHASAAAAEKTVAPRGHLRVTASIAFGQVCLIPYLLEFRLLHPEIAIDLITSDANLDLIAERIDVAIRLGARLDVGYVGARLRPTRYRVCASPAYLAREGRVRAPRDLAGRSCLLLDLPRYRERWRFKGKTGAITEIPVQGDLVLSNVTALHACALNGMGPALLADWLVNEDIAQGKLVDLFPTLQATATDFETAAWILYPSRSYLPAKVRAFVDFTRQKLGKA